MSGKTKIEWTECSWNPITGCSKISDGCKNCYAERLSKRLVAMKNPRYINGFDVTIHSDLIEAPKKWKTPRKIFVNSMSDLFHEKVPEQTILDIFETMNDCPQHQFQILTKRSERLKELNPKINWTSNIWMGVTVESHKYLDRINYLRDSNAKIKFVSAEPLLDDLIGLDLLGIDWIIVGGESGPGARKMEKQWVDNIKTVARQNKTAFFFKQWGGTNKKKNGRELDGKIYSEYPQS